MASAGQLLKQKGFLVHRVEPTDPVLEAIRRMAEHGIGALLVMHEAQLVGIVSERDYARKVILLGRSSGQTAVQEIMSSPVITVAPSQSLHACLQIMTDRRVRHLPVVEGGRVLGVLSIGDLVRALLEEQRQTIQQLEQYIHS